MKNAYPIPLTCRETMIQHAERLTWLVSTTLILLVFGLTSGKCDAQELFVRWNRNVSFTGRVDFKTTMATPIGQPGFAVRSPLGELRTGSSTDSLAVFNTFSSFEEMRDDLVGTWEFLAIDENDNTSLLTEFTIRSFDLTDLITAPTINSPLPGAIISSDFVVEGEYPTTRTAEVNSTFLTAWQFGSGPSTFVSKTLVSDDQVVRFQLMPDLEKTDPTSISLQFITDQEFDRFLELPKFGPFVGFTASDESAVVIVDVVVVPEPVSGVLMLMALLGLSTIRFKPAMK